MTSLWLDRERDYATDQFVPDADFDDVVVGAGLTGLVTALLLARSGRRVAVLEARQVGAVTTGNTTGKLSLLQGTVLSTILKHNAREVGHAYVEGNREGLAWLLHYCEHHDIGVQRRDAFTYANTPAGNATVRHEVDAGRQLGLDVTYVEDLELPFPTYGAARLVDQAQFDPMEVLTSLVSDLRQHGGVVFEGTRVLDVVTGRPDRIITAAGELRAEHVILATGTPILDRGLYFAKLSSLRSYGLAFRVPGPIPQGMYLSADSPSRSLRTAPRADEQLLVVGGNGHIVGREPSPQHQVDDLTRWTQTHFPDAERTHVWSAQDYQSHNLIPFVGKLPRGGGHVYLATGYNKWGMTNAVAAALRISAEILGGHLPWALVLGRRITHPSSIAKGLQAGAAIGVQTVRGWAASELNPLSAADRAPAEGQGVVGRQGVKPVAVSTVHGQTCAVSAVCPHLGGVLRWNDAELSWDCPLHGSRFDSDGILLEGPATADLEVYDA
ncbi:MAG: FAD-dependent oxidoreductase [Propionibacteriaceae bacterium]